MITSISAGAPATATSDPSSDLVMNAIPAVAARLTAVRTSVLGWLRTCGLDEDTCQDITLATYEALANGVEHAYDHAPSGGPGTIDLRAEFGPEGSVVIRVTDQGIWTISADDPRRGRGLPLIHALAHEASVETTDQGTTVVMRWVGDRSVSR
ncbi:ATP-binding protein [Rhodococcus sp. MEB064]|uniref:ATP-binding protein n=1 Tax=Rhodococcus sp. MEB064 TaxID=1587522 RepID=UPI000698970F|nr:ATP-binding protein [Rhodococcus sp. MEB064]